MIIFAITMCLAFAWLLWETKFLTVRLLVGSKLGIDVNELVNLMMAVAISIHIVGLVLELGEER